jgi:hypothetical protein
MSGENSKQGGMPDVKGMKPIIVIGIDEAGNLIAVGPFDKKDYCISLLADTIKFAVTVQAPPAKEESNIIVPKSGVIV